MNNTLDKIKGKVVYAEDVLDLFYVASAGQDKTFIEVVETVIEDAPEADVVEIKYGKLIGIRDNNTDCVGCCSECGTPHTARNYTSLIAAYRYCRWCGVKLRGDV